MCCAAALLPKGPKGAGDRQGPLSQKCGRRCGRSHSTNCAFWKVVGWTSNHAHTEDVGGDREQNLLFVGAEGKLATLLALFLFYFILFYLSPASPSPRSPHSYSCRDRRQPGLSMPDGNRSVTVSSNDHLYRLYDMALSIYTSGCTLFSDVTAGNFFPFENLRAIPW